MVNPYASVRVESSLYILEGTYNLVHERLVHGRPIYKQEIAIVKPKNQNEASETEEENSSEDHCLFLW